MESQPQDPEFRIHPENFHPCLQGGQRVQTTPGKSQKYRVS